MDYNTPGFPVLHQLPKLAQGLYKRAVGGAATPPRIESGHLRPLSHLSVNPERTLAGKGHGDSVHPLPSESLALGAVGLQLEDWAVGGGQL